MKCRIKFSKNEEMVYVGHLDMVRFFQKVFKRAKLDITYSQGFSPHQLISFASPLGIGVETKGDYLDVFFNRNYEPAFLVEELNKVMCKGVAIEGAYIVEDESKHSNAMSLLKACSYTVIVKDEAILSEYENIYEKIAEIYKSSDHIDYVKETKKGSAAVDLKECIYEIRPTSEGIYMKLASGSSLNIKPEDAVSCILGKEITRVNALIRREDMFAYKDGKLVSLGEA